MSVKHNIAANFFGQAWAAVMGLIFVPLYIHFLGMEAYGLMGVFAVLQTWLSLLDFGLTPTLTRQMARPVSTLDDARRLWNLLRSIEVFVATSAAATVAAVWAGSGWIASSWLHSQRLARHTIVGACVLMGVVVALRFFENMYQGSMVGLQKQVALNVTTSSMATLRGAGAVAVLAWVSNSVEAFFVWQAVMSLVTTSVFASMVYRNMPRRTTRPVFSWGSLLSVRKFSTSTFAISFLGFMISQSDKLVLSRALKLAEFGQYTLAATLAAYVRLLATSIDQAVYPKFVELYADGRFAELARYYHRATQVSVVLMGGVGLGLGLFGEYFLLAWTHDHGLTRAVYPLLWILLIGFVTNGLMNGPSYLMLAAGWTSMMLKMNIAMALVFVPFLVWAVSAYGAVGAAATWVVVNAVYLVVIVSLMHRRLLPAEKWRWYFEDLAGPLGCACVCGLTFRALFQAPREPTFSGVIFIAGCSVTLTAAAFAAPYTRHLLAGLLSRARRYLPASG